MKNNIIKFDTISSTNKYLKDNYQSLDEYTVCHSLIQTEGKGRMMRKWESDNGCLSFSILLKPKKENVSIISLIAGASVCTLINRYTDAKIKWPNDIIVDNKKICGILLESVSCKQIEAVVVGIGINVNQECFISELKDKAISLKMIMKKEFNLDSLLKETLDIFFDLYQQYLKDDYSFLDILRNNNYLKNKVGLINNKEYKILDIDDNGNLIVEDDNNQISHIYSGEVSLNSFYNNHLHNN